MLEYIGPDCVYENLIPHETIHLVPGQQYDAQITTDAQQIMVNGTVMSTPPSKATIVFASGSWMDCNLDRVEHLWKQIQMI